MGGVGAGDTGEGEMGALGGATTGAGAGGGAGGWMGNAEPGPWSTSWICPSAAPAPATARSALAFARSACAAFGKLS